MGHRKQTAPRHGSLAFLPRKRAESVVPRIRHWPSLGLNAPAPLAFGAYKVGMTQAIMVDERENSATRGREIAVPVTIMEAPPLVAVGARVYGNGQNGKTVKKEVWSSKLPDDLFRKLVTLKNAKAKGEAKVSSEDVSEGDEVRLIVCTQPRLTGSKKKTPDVFEVKVDGGPLEDIVSYVNSNLGKEIKVGDVLQPGSFVDVFGITKGKGWAGVVKRYGVKIMDRKSNKTRRGIATMGAKSPSNVMFTVPRGGQMGYHQRPVRNLMVVKVGPASEAPVLDGGFLRYGTMKSDYLLIEGSVPGPAKRFMKLRVSARKGSAPLEPPKLTHVSTTSQQGA